MESKGLYLSKATTLTRNRRLEDAEYMNGMDSDGLFMTRSSLEVLSKQIGFFMCRDAFFAQKICAEGLALVFSLLWFSRDLRGPNLLLLSLLIVN